MSATHLLHLNLKRGCSKCRSIKLYQPHHKPLNCIHLWERIIDYNLQQDYVWHFLYWSLEVQYILNHADR